MNTLIANSCRCTHVIGISLRRKCEVACSKIKLPDTIQLSDDNYSIVFLLYSHTQ